MSPQSIACRCAAILVALTLAAVATTPATAQTHALIQTHA